MSNFTITATAECDYCGNLLSSSDEECDACMPANRKRQLFRRINAHSAEIETIVVDATFGHKWQKLADELGEDWIAYEYLGPKESVEHMLTSGMWNTLADIPRREMSANAPSDIDVS